MQISIGAFVSGMDAGMIYNSWPLMGTSFFPDDSLMMDLFNLESFNDPSLVQFMHRSLAYLIFIKGLRPFRYFIKTIPLCQNNLFKI